MARSLKLKPNITAPSAQYPYGRIKDDTGSNDGTPVNEDVYGDFHQFFAKLLAESGKTANELPENAYDGFQYYDALIRSGWKNIALASGWSNSGTNKFQYKKRIDGSYAFRGAITKASVTATNFVTLAAIPSEISTDLVGSTGVILPIFVLYDAFSGTSLQTGASANAGSTVWFNKENTGNIEMWFPNSVPNIVASTLTIFFHGITIYGNAT